MNAKEIDELLEACIEEDWEKIIRFADIEIIDEDVENFFDKNVEKILERLVIKIEQGDYDYFYSKIKEERYKDICIDLLCYSSKVEDIKEVLEKREELGLDRYNLVYLIKATNDTEYIKGIIENKEKAEGLGLKENDLIDFIIATGDIEYINDFLKSIENEQNTENSNQIVNLPDNMTIGIEIESEGEKSKLILATKSMFAVGWKCKEDCSLNEGVEVVSPILSENTEQTSEAIKYVCRILNVLRSNGI